MAAITREDIHLIVSIFLGSLIAVQAWDISDVPTMESIWGVEPTGVESTAGIAKVLFGSWSVPFEVLSVLLLVAIVGAIAIAVRDDEGGIV